MPSQKGNRMKTYKIKLTDCIHPNVAGQADDTRVLDLKSDEFDDSDIEEEVSQEEASLAPMEAAEAEITVAPLTEEEKQIYEWPGIKEQVKRAKSANVIQTEDDAETVDEAYDMLREHISDTDIDKEEFKRLVTAASAMSKRSCRTLWMMRVWAMLDAGMRSADGDKKLIRALDEDSKDDFAYEIALDAYESIAFKHPFGSETRVPWNRYPDDWEAQAKAMSAAQAHDAASSAADMCPVLRSTIAHNIAEALKMKGFTKIDADVYEAYGDSVMADISCVKGTNTFKMEAVDTDELSMRVALDIISKAADRYADCSNQTYKLSPYHE